MKTVPFLFALFCISTTLTFSQDSASSSGGFFTDLTVGVKAGINFSNMYGDVGNNSFLVFPHAGVVVDKALNESITISTEPHLSGEGQNLNGGYDQIIYLNLPVLVKYTVADQVSLDAGLHAGVKITETTKFGTTGEKENRNRFKRIAPGLTGGATYKINSNWFTQARANLKLSDVVRKEGGDSEGSTILTFQISVGYTFDNK